mmetsp:Transcript_49047/g.56492  ORF Transcript_49047/g.56492 Transcript_49047/m.56492 type:complete len:136 (+) Transcript_49047:23-430(+)
MGASSGSAKPKSTTDDSEFAKKFSYQRLREGDGKTFPTAGEKVEVHYRGTLLDGKQFDSSYDRNRPFEFNVGVGQVIKCWDEVVSRMSLGEKCLVVCPSETAYGSRGAGRVIGPNADLRFEIEMLGFGGQKYRSK